MLTYQIKTTWKQLMRQTISGFGVIVFSLIYGCGSLNPHQENTVPVNHDAFTGLLQQYVDEDGSVDYESFISDEKTLKEYISYLENNAPNDSAWTEPEQIAYWINLYNAATIALVLEHYPINSIKDIGSSIQIPFVNTPWDIKFLEIAGEKYDLNNIEHNILRKNWNEPRIHFAINCASKSCPRLRREAYTGDNLDAQLEEQAILFINDEFRNSITTESTELSKIFSWFSGDFERDGDLKSFINRYSRVKMEDETNISFKPYDWSLNSQ